MVVALLAFALAAAFTGAAVYINIAEHPARLTLDDRPQLAQMEAELPGRRRHAGQPGAGLGRARPAGVVAERPRRVAA